MAALRPRLRSSVQTHRQHFRGQTWHVLQDPSNNQFFRLSEAAYHFVALLDGKRTVADAWKICNEQLGDSAPTQGEAIQLMGQLYSSNLLQAEMPPDAQGLLSRHRKRRSREIRSYVSNLLYIQIPLLDPDRFLDGWVKLFGMLFSWAGALLWMVMVGIGLYFVMGRTDEIYNQAKTYIDQQRILNDLPLLYLTFAIVKACHEFGHAFACKKFGRQSGSGGEVHHMGIMFMVFMPVPFVDASSSHAFRSKWHKMMVGAAGMWVEIMMAAVAAIVWANTANDSTVHALAWNVMLIGSITTVLFNGNPLLRYDGYYILSDFLEIANLQQRSKEYLQYLVKKYVYGIKLARNPAHTTGERIWFVFYGISSTVYRTIVVIAILAFIANQMFVLGVLLAITSAIAWLLVPIGKFVHYLFAGQELARHRMRAMLATAGFVLLLVGGLGVLPARDTVIVEGVVEPQDMQIVYSRGEGFVQRILPTNTDVKTGDVLVEASNPELEHDLVQLELYRRSLLIQKNQLNLEKDEDRAKAGAIDKILANTDDRIANAREKLSFLKVTAAMDGVWISPKADTYDGIYMRREEPLGMVASKDVTIRAVADQNKGQMLIAETLPEKKLRPVQVRLKDRPGVQFAGLAQKPPPAGRKRLPSQALAYSVGGSIAVDPNSRDGSEAAEEFFELEVVPQGTKDSEGKDLVLLSGQRVTVRFDMPARPLAYQWGRTILQLLPRQFNILP